MMASAAPAAPHFLSMILSLSRRGSDERQYIPLGNVAGIGRGLL
jgi:hypothetical protein